MAKESFQVPYRTYISTPIGMITKTWESFFRTLHERLDPLGDEQSAQLQEGVLTPAAIEGLKLDSSKQQYVIIEFLLQRIHTGTISGTLDLADVGYMNCVYRPKLKEWTAFIKQELFPDVTGFALSMGIDGQVKYTSTNLGGTKVLSRITYRMRTMSAKTGEL